MNLQELRLQPEDNFVLKVVQLEELIHVRHSVFVIGNAGTGEGGLEGKALSIAQGRKIPYLHRCVIYIYIGTHISTFIG